MSKKPAPKNFSNLLDDVTAPTSAPEASKPGKGPLLTFHIDDDLKLQLDRVVFWKGKGGSQRLVINEALRAYLQASPTAQQPIPGE